MSRPAAILAYLRCVRLLSAHCTYQLKNTVDHRTWASVMTTRCVPDKKAADEVTISAGDTEHSSSTRKTSHGGNGKKGAPEGGRGRGRGDDGIGAAAFSAGAAGTARAALVGSARGVRPKRGGEVDHAKVDPEQKKHLTVLVKQALANIQQVAWSPAAVYSTYIRPVQSSTIRAPRVRRNMYADKCKEAGGGHTSGPPNGHLYATLTSSLFVADVGGKTRAVPTEHGKTCSTE
ncbi:unnamed protein product [Prorocentrum cordatum]|uniref:Uncharacterized protein n=1 Tax=Prorocentrum cordatum TaxID=2364126 RepID=A0ABN9YCJ5_9DINO|nr:unnamed protein product [Polarella glacialis]